MPKHKSRKEFASRSVIRGNSCENQSFSKPAPPLALHHAKPFFALPPRCLLIVWAICLRSCVASKHQFIVARFFIEREERLRPADSLCKP